MVRGLLSDTIDLHGYELSRNTIIRTIIKHTKDLSTETVKQILCQFQDVIDIHALFLEDEINDAMIQCIAENFRDHIIVEELRDQYRDYDSELDLKRLLALIKAVNPQISIEALSVEARNKYIESL